MLLGMTEGEIGLVLFIFGLVYSAQWVPRLGEFLGEKLGMRDHGESGRLGDGRR